MQVLLLFLNNRCAYCMSQFLFKCQKKSLMNFSLNYVLLKHICQSRLQNVRHTLTSIVAFIISSLVVGAASLFTASSVADDTELYVFEASARNGSRPQVLIIFDNSGSMSNLAYGVDAPYENKRNANYAQSGKLFYSRGSADNAELPNPASSREMRQFNAALNGCESSWDYLNRYGTFTGFFREYGFSGGTGAWKEFSELNGSSIAAVDCFEDIQEERLGNAAGEANGLPVDSLGSAAKPVRYTAVNIHSSESAKASAKAKAQKTGFGSGKVVTVYTEDYLKWHHGTKKKVNKTRLELAQDAIESVVLTTPGVDFGLAIFNMNGPRDGARDGGRIISGIKTMSAQAKIDLLKRVNLISYAQNTPLCETLYEAYRYFGGQEQYFGDDDSDYNYYDNWGRYQGTYNASSNPFTDPAALIIGGNTYNSPFKPCQNEAYIVYITDGEPTLDNAADGIIERLTNGVGKHTSNPKSYLSALSGWMRTEDVNPNLAGKQTVRTFTIGFSEGAASAEHLLKQTADNGGGKYFDATDASQLRSSLQTALNNILEKNASFTSPSVASNNFNRTQTFDSAYYSMFLPNKGPRWLGNIKKFKVTSDGDVVDSKGKNVIGEDGNIKADACSYWTSAEECGSSGDGNDVKRGGVLAAMQQATSRTLYSNFGSGLSAFTLSNAARKAGDNVRLATYMGVDETELTGLFDWAKGIDVDNDKNQDLSTASGATPNWRADIMGDALHSKPLALNFGSEAKPDIRILVGTNHGFLHMFKDEGDSVSEAWGFIPYELLPNFRDLKANAPTGVHSVYGIDGSPVAYTKMQGKRIEKAWVFVGMRRGGNAYYALDVTTPDNPSFMWKIDASSPGMGELGQSWSTPVVTTIPSATGDKPVLIFGGGYSPSTKDGAEIGTDDSSGRGVFIVDAQTGALIHQFGGSGANTPLPGIANSIPSSVAVLDGNGDGHTDRIYATDIQGNVWRMDMPSANVSTWSGFKFAALGDKSSVAGDRRFFSGPIVAQTLISNTFELTKVVNGTSTKVVTSQNIPYDAIVVGSGHRAKPSDVSRSDMFFALQDRNIVTQSFQGKSNQKPVPKTLQLSDLYDVSSAAPNDQASEIVFSQKRGWYYNFSRKGEKSLSSATIVGGEVYFSSFVPGSDGSVNQCLSSGKGYLYKKNLHRGTRGYKTDYLYAGELVLDTPQLVIPPAEQPKDPNAKVPTPDMFLIGIGNAVPDEATCESGNPKCIGGGPTTNKIYYYISQ